MILNITLLIVTILMSVRCSSVMDSLSQKTIYVSNYCPTMKYCKEGTHVMCMYYDHNRPFGPRCSNHVNIKITPKIVEQVLKTVNFIRSKLATGQETGRDNQPLPRAYGMMRIGWDSELATLAQVLANQCLGGREDSCRATDKFATPSQSIAIIQFKYPNWEHLSQNSTQQGLNDDKLAFAVEKYLKALYALKKSVTKKMVVQCPPMIKLPHYYSKLYLNLIRGEATHIGCGMSAYTRYGISKNGRQSINNCVEIVCNLSDRPHPFAPIYTTEPPLPGLGYSDDCGCPKGFKETSGCLCEEEQHYDDTHTASNLTQEKRMSLLWLNNPLPQTQPQPISQPQAQSQAWSRPPPLTQLQAQSQGQLQEWPQTPPLTQMHAQSKAQSQAQSQAQLQPQLQAQLQQQPQVQAKAQPQAQQQSRPQAWLKPRPKPQLNPHQQVRPQAQPQPRPQALPDAQPQDWPKAQVQAQMKAQPQAQPQVQPQLPPNTLRNTAPERCSNPNGNCESQVLLLPIFSIQDAPPNKSVDRSHQIDQIGDLNFISSSNDSFLPIELPMDKTKLPGFERLEDLSNIFQNTPNKEIIKPQIFYTDPEYTILPRGKFPNDQVPKIFKNIPKKERVNPQILRAFEEKAKKEKTKLQFIDSRDKLSARDGSSNNQMMVKQEIEVKNMLKKPIKIKNVNNGELRAEKDLADQYRYSNETNIKDDTIDVNDKYNDDNTRIMSLIDNLEQAVKHIELSGDKKEIFQARMRKMFKIINNKFKEYSNQNAAIQPDNFKSDFIELMALTPKESKINKVNNYKNVGQKYDDKVEENDRLDDRLIEILSHSVDNENLYQAVINNLDNANKDSLYRLGNDSLFRSNNDSLYPTNNDNLDPMNNDNLYPTNNDNLDRMNNDNSYLVDNLNLNQKNNDNSDTQINPNVYHQYDVNDEFEYNKPVSRHQKTLSDYNNYKDIIERQSSVGITSDIGKYMDDLTNVKSGIDPFSSNDKGNERNQKSRDGRITTNIIAKNNNGQILGTRKFNNFKNLERKVQNSRTFRPIMGYNDNPSMRRMQEDEVHTRTLQSEEEDAFLGNRAIL